MTNASARHTGIAILAALLVLRLALLLTFRFGTAAALGAGEEAGRTALASTNLWIVLVDLVTLVVVAWLLRREGTSLRALIGRWRPADLGWGSLVGLGMLMVLLVVTFLGNPLMYQGPPPAAGLRASGTPPLWYALWCVLLMPVTIAFAEEALYRGFLQPRFAARFGRVLGAGIVALFFGLQHLAFVGPNPRAAFVRVLATFAGGVLLAWLYERFGRRLWPLIIGHWLADVVGLGLPVLLMALVRA